MKVRHLIEQLERCQAGAHVQAVIQNAEEIGFFDVEGMAPPPSERTEKGEESACLSLRPDAKLKNILRRYFWDIKDAMGGKFYP